MVKVRVRNPQFERRHLYFFDVPEFFDYEGDEVKPGKWENPAEVLCLTTGIKDFPIRSIQRKNIVTIDGKTQSKGTAKITTKVVIGSKGNEYVLTNSNGRWTCTCPGFQFRQNCKHTAEA